MDDQQLNRALRSVGMSCFIKYFRELSNLSLSNQSVGEMLMERETYTDKSCISRVSKARSIIRAGRDRDALLMIANAANVSGHTAEQARALADGLGAG